MDEISKLKASSNPTYISLAKIFNSNVEKYLNNHLIELREQARKN